MNLDEYLKFPELDPEGMLAEIDNLPEQFEKAWNYGLSQPLPQMSSINYLVVAGMGGSAIGADLIASYIADRCPVPVIVHRDYNLPPWANGRETLAVICSHSGNTEESLSALESAVRNHCQIVTISTGGKLQAMSQNSGLISWVFEHKGQPRAAVGFSFGLLLALLVRLGLVSDPSVEVEEAVNVMREQRKHLKAEVPVSLNPAKRMAGQMMGRIVTVFGAGHLAPVARRWKCQINELANAEAGFEFLPEADHNTLAGSCNPENCLQNSMKVFLQSSSDHPRNALRLQLTRQMFMEQGINTDFYQAQGDSLLAQMWSAIQFGDYSAYYLALAYDTNPTQIPPITALKEAMSK